jgi:hypothetical protein
MLPVKTLLAPLLVFELPRIFTSLAMFLAW